MRTLLVKLLEYLEKNEYAKIHTFSNEAGRMVYAIENAANGVQIEFIPELLILHVLRQADDFSGYILDQAWEFDEMEHGDWLCVFDAADEE